MTKATMIWPRLRMEVSGHAGAGTEGNDIVCAGVSILVYTLARMLQEQEQRGRLTFTFEEKPGSAVITADPRMDCLNETKAYFRMAVTGLKMLKEEYRDNVDIKEVI